MRLTGNILAAVLLGWPALAALPEPVTGYAVRFDSSPPFFSTEALSLKPRKQFRGPELTPLKRKVHPLRPGTGFDAKIQSFSIAAIPTPTITFAGVSNSDNLTSAVPPDPNGDVGPNHYVQMVNQSIQVYDKSGTPLTGSPLSLNGLFAGFGGLCEEGVASDPIILYDPLADRWLMSFLAFDISLLGTPVPPFHQCVACSQTADPTGSYFLYDFQMPNNWVNDYPKFGVWPDAYYMTDNQFDAATEDAHGAGVFAFDRAKMLAGDPNASFIFFDLESLDPNIDGLLPADLDGPPPPAGTPNYMVCMTADEFVGDTSDALRVFQFHADFANPGNSTFTERPESPVATAAFNPVMPCGASERDCVPQPSPAGTSSRLDTLTDRLMHRLQYRNFGSNESLVVNHTVNVGGANQNNSHAAVRYYQLRRTTGAFAINEQASFAPDARHRWMGSAAMDRNGNLAVGYSVSASNVFPSIRYAGRLASDPAGGLFQGETNLWAGGGSQTDTASRWGDYSALAVDPVDDCTFWYTTEFYSTSSTDAWETRIGTFKFSACPAVPKGTLQGTVTDASSGLPIAGAVVQTANGFLRTTSGTGTYSMSLPPDTYQATASAPNHGSKSAAGLVIVNGGTVTQNFALPPVPVLAFVSSSLTDGNNNGGIDPNECINLNIVLENTGAITASNIVGTLSSSTAGITIAQPIAAYSNAAVGVSRTNATPFRFSTPVGLVCGAPIQLLLTVTHNGGTNTIPVTLNTGSGIAAPTRFDSTDTPLEISPFFGSSSAIDVTGIASSIARVTLSFHMTSDENGDLDMYLVGPDNTTVTLVTGASSFGSDYGTACSPDSSRTTLDDAAGSSIYDGTNSFTGTYRPEEPLSAFNGKSANGTWTLAVGNFIATATLECWSLNISPPSCVNGPGACAVTDTDADGLPDWWEQFYFGSATSAVAGQDTDGDGFTNLQEFLTLTDPKNAGSALRVTGIQRVAGNTQISFASVSGKSYSVEFKSNLLNAVWSTLSSNIAGTGSDIQIVDTGATNSPARFYHIHLLP